MPNPNRTKNVAVNTARSGRERPEDVGGLASATSPPSALGGRAFDQLDPYLVGVEHEGDAPRAAGDAVGFLRHRDSLRTDLQQESIEVRNLERQVVELLAGFELFLPVPVRELDPRTAHWVADERDLRLVLGDRAAALELESQHLGVERKALVHAPDGDRGVQELHRSLAPEQRRDTKPSAVTDA